VKVILLGDVGWRSQYHVGDEAMTEVAIQQLRQRGVDSITLVAGEPGVATALYGCPAIPRIGYHSTWSRQRLEATRADFERAILGSAPGTPQMSSMLDAIRSADVAMIAGGGNLNSKHAYHLFERWSFAQAAKHNGVPLYVVSQTVGPGLDPADTGMLTDILDYATFFGAREAGTHRLLAGMRGHHRHVSHTMDDAILLRSSTVEFVTPGELDPNGRYIVASFAHAPTPPEFEGLSYPKLLAGALDKIATSLDVGIALVPHVGSLESSVFAADEELGQEVAAASNSDRLVAIPTSPASKVLQITEHALASISTRYHQTVFSAALGVPSLAFETSEYDSVRMRGAHHNMAMRGYVLPAAALIDGDLPAMLREVCRASPTQEVGPLLRISEERHDFQNRVWDSLVSSFTSTPYDFPSLHATTLNLTKAQPPPGPALARYGKASTRQKRSMMKDIDAGAPLISLVIPAYNVERYLPEFLQSLSRQELANVELIFVDDGSPDESATTISAWLSANPNITGRMIRQKNRGLSNARNAGLEQASGEWVSFPDPDDILGPAYIANITAAIDSVGPEATMIAAPLITYIEETGERGPRHPLQTLFSRGAGLFRLNEHPSALKIHANSSFLRRALLMKLGLKFDSDIRPNFEDTALIARYLSASENPAIAAVPHAEYLYRTRADASSLVASSWTNPMKYTVLPKAGWLALLKETRAKLGFIPAWLQNIVVYDMSWYFKNDARIHTPTKRLDASTRSTFMDLVKEVVAYLDPEVIENYEVTSLSTEIRAVLLAMRGDDFGRLPVKVWRADNTRGIIQLKYYFAGTRPGEVFEAEGTTLLPVHAKDRAINYFGRTVLSERIVWVAYRPNLRVTIDGSVRTVQPASAASPALSISPSIIRRAGWRVPSPVRPVSQIWQPALKSPSWLQKQVHLRLGQLRRILHGRSPRFLKPWDRFTMHVAKRSKKYANAWVFMDRDVQAQDNAEHLYRWVASERPQVNSWFVLSRRSADWSRLKAAGFRLVDHGSWQHTLLLLRASHLASSHVDHYVVQPLNPKRFGARRWSYTFLQHGVTKDDISRWLNSKPIRRIISTGPAEQSGFTGDGTPYTFTNRESVLTGFPRHDELLRLTKNSAVETRGLILVVPTWREYLLGPTNGKGNYRPLAENFSQSEYVRGWQSFLSSPQLHEAARAHGKKIVFLPHPNLEPHIGALELPRSVEVRRYSDCNVQQVLADAAVMVTDYSSIAFDGAYIGATSVYFQFDREEFFSSHPHRPGYFSYDDDGFGPVVTTVVEAVEATIANLEDRAGLGKYRARAQTFFSYRDGRCCERVFDAMVAIDHPEQSTPATGGNTTADTDPSAMASASS